MTRLFLITLLLLSSGPAFAEWIKVSDSNVAGKAVYVDPSTIRRNSNLVKMWQFYDYKTVQTVGGFRFLTAEEQWEFAVQKNAVGWLLSSNSQAIWEVERWFSPTHK